MLEERGEKMAEFRAARALGRYALVKWLLSLRQTSFIEIFFLPLLATSKSTLRKLIRIHNPTLCLKIYSEAKERG